MKKMFTVWLLAIFCAGMGIAQDYPDREKEVRTLLQETDPFAKEEKICFLQKINLGIPGGENWIAVWHRDSYDDFRDIVFYAINRKQIIERFTCQMADVTTLDGLEFDILKNIPGIRITNGSCVIGDYNGDGIHEILNYAYNAFGVGWSTEFFIEGYDPRRKQMETFADIVSDIPELEEETPPVEFITHKGIYGFKIYERLFLDERDIKWNDADEPMPIMDDHAWFFYAWNPGTRHYTKIEELGKSRREGQQ